MVLVKMFKKRQGMSNFKVVPIGRVGLILIKFGVSPSFGSSEFLNEFERNRIVFVKKCFQKY